MKISRILHAGYVFESGPTQIIFDPIFENPFSRNAYAFPDVGFDYGEIRKLKPDAIFISHYHDDHCSMESLQYLNRETPVYFYCIHEELFELIRQLGFKNVIPLQANKTVKVGEFEVTARLALDPDVDSIFHIKAGGVNILNVVDAWIDPSALPVLCETTWDMVLWPFQTMREVEVIAPELAHPAELPDEWLEQLKLLNPKIIVPSSCQFIHEEWSWYRKAYFPISYSFFAKKVSAALPDSKVLRLNPGVSVLIGEKAEASARLPWVTAMGPQDVDYEYDPHVKPQATADIARHFPGLSAEKTKRVMQFCEKEIFRKYNSMGTDLNVYWRLILFDHYGHAIIFNYKIEKGNMVFHAAAADGAWQTEIPIQKLYAALEEGESLSSLYVRVNGLTTENIFDDPLISTIFNGDIGCYQRNQLKKILN